MRKWYNFETIPNADSLMKLADFFDCSTDYLIGRAKHSEELNHAIDCLSDENQKLVEQYAKLLFLKQMQEEKELNDAYEKIGSEITDFDKKYRFADRNEKVLIEQFLSGLRFSVNGIRLFQDEPVSHNRMFLCFMSGRKPMLNNYLVGDYSDLMNDLGTLSKISQYQLMIDVESENGSRHCVYIRDDGTVFNASI